MRRHTTHKLLPVVTVALAWALVGTIPCTDARASNARPKVDNPHGKFKEDCSLCHSANAWKPAKISKKFDHEKYGIPLTGAHSSVKCTQCHTSLDFEMAPTSCVDCHSDVHNGEMGDDCARCHGTKSFVDRNDQVRMHRLTRFPLGGAHQTLDCEMCHKLSSPDKMSFVNTPTECVSCHLEQYNATTQPNHASAGFSQDCASCHNDQAWARVKFDHSQTNFPLTGMHAAIHCDQCHVGNVFTGLSTACVSCHQSDYDGTSSPAHASAGFPTNCEQCHSTKGWAGALFDHSTTQFPLTGAHKAVACDQCHVGGKYIGMSTACISCHQSDFNGTTDPAHVSAGFPTTCEQCHTTKAWTGATFDHNATNFPLTGMHKTVTCDQCHAGGQYTISTACVSCHQSDYNGTNNPPHASAGFPTTCEQCHSTQGWSGALFDHSTTNFPLTGSHRAVACDQCHVNNKYIGLSTACVSCHQSDYDGTTDPNHAASHFPTNCEQCHTTTTWSGATFNHSTTNFPLTGAHASVACDQCHGGGVYAGLSTACVSCHQSDYDGTNDPAHAAAGFPTNCEQCHSTSTWQGATFNHDTFFPIYSGKHKGRWNSCDDCHTNAANYQVFSCLGCHPHDDKAGTDSKHRGKNGYSYESNACYSCHPRGNAG